MSDLGEQCRAFARFEVDVLQSLLQAIREWCERRRESLNDQGEDVATADCETDAEAIIAQEMLSDDFALYERTARAMFGTLAVAIASTTEKFIESICQWAPIPIEASVARGKPRPDVKDKMSAIERRFGLSLRRLSGFDQNKRARLLSNCFKHNRGRATAEYAGELGTPEGKWIAYEDEDWSRMIDETRRYLLAISEHLRGHEVRGSERYDDYVGIVDVPTNGRD